MTASVMADLDPAIGVMPMASLWRGTEPHRPGLMVGSGFAMTG